MIKLGRLNYFPSVDSLLPNWRGFLCVVLLLLLQPRVSPAPGFPNTLAKGSISSPVSFFHRIRWRLVNDRMYRHVMGDVRLLCCHPSITIKPSRRTKQGQLDTPPSSSPRLLLSSPSFWPDEGFFLRCPGEITYTTPMPVPVSFPLLS